jgi:hypothetical protein
MIESLNSLRPGSKTMLLCRVSSPHQAWADSLRGQLVHLPLEVARRGGVVLAVESFTQPATDGRWLRTVMKLADRARKEGAVVVVATLDRVVRHRAFVSTCRVGSKLRASRGDLARLEDALGGVPVLSYLDPDAGVGEATSLLTRWGLAVKDRKQLRGMAVEMRSLGFGWRRITRVTGVPRSTVRRWVSDTKRQHTPASDRPP